MQKSIEEFIENNKFLNDNFNEVNYHDFYRDVFPKGSFENKGNYTENKGNGIAVEIMNTKSNNVIITDDLKAIDELVKCNFVVTSPISYYGRVRTARMSTLMYGLAFDLDNVGLKQLIELHHQTMTINVNPRPTYIVNSGHGMHLYYIFKEPIKLYDHIKEPLKELKFALTNDLWNINTSRDENKQFQGINQPFRMVGSPTKLGKEYRLKAFKTGDKVDLEYLNKFVAEDKQIKSKDYQSKLSLEEAKEKYPDWYDKKIVQGKKTTGRWETHKGLYYWWLEKIKNEAIHGHRYFAVMTLAIFAKKSNIPFDILEKDAISLIPIMTEKMKSEPFTKEDVNSALKSYNENYVKFPRKDIEKLTAIEIPKNKRNGRTQEMHLKLARGQLAILYELGEVKVGRPKGTGTKEELVTDYIKDNPNDNPTEIARNLGISRPTVYKYKK